MSAGKNGEPLKHLNETVQFYFSFKINLAVVWLEKLENAGMGDKDAN